MTAKSVLEGKWVLQDLGELIDWASMKFKPSKSRSLILKKGKVQDRKIMIGGDIIQQTWRNQSKAWASGLETP